ncbi:MAG TPA: glycoside hydrolase family 30 beta sandwich domain-containing protein [Polyangiaceae bacterium]
MIVRRFHLHSWLVAVSLPIACCAAGCHGGELIFGSGSEGAMAGQGGLSSSGVTDAGSVQAYTLVTSNEDAYWTTNVPVIEVTSEAADITVAEDTVAQLWEGFGGAFNELGWNYLTMNGLQDEALPLLFGEEGCRFAFGRIPIGANDYAMDRYTLDETAGDYGMQYFSMDRDRRALIPYVKAALALNPNLHFWACPWTPPTWMKTGQKAGPAPSAFDGGSMTDDPAILGAYARYLTQFVLAYGTEGITIETVSPQNEPSYEENFPSCLWDAGLYAQFIGSYLGPSLEAAGLSTKVMLGTLSSDTVDPEFAARVGYDANARRYIGVAGMQWDMLRVVAGMQQQMQGLPIWQTEHKGGNYPWNPSGSPPYQRIAPNDHAYAIESWGLIRDWIKAGVTAYYAWNMVLDGAGKSLNTSRDWSQNALLVVDAGRLIKTPTYYVFRHLSQFVAPQARVLGTTGGDALAFRNPDGRIVTVIYNRAAAKRLVVAFRNKKLAFDMPGNGWATLR